MDGQQLGDTLPVSDAPHKGLKFYKSLKTTVDLGVSVVLPICPSAIPLH